MIKRDEWFGIPYPRFFFGIVFAILASFAIVIVLGVNLHVAVLLGGIMFPQIYAVGYLTTGHRHFAIRRFWFLSGIVWVIIYSGIILFFDDIDTGFKVAPDIQSFFIYNILNFIFVALMAIHLHRKKELRKALRFI
jgi:hypothetical protein